MAFTPTSTGDPTGNLTALTNLGNAAPAPVNPAQAIQPVPNPAAATPTVDINNMVTQKLADERRIRELQSIADQKRAEAEKAAATLAQKEAELAQYQATQSSVIDGAAKLHQEHSREIAELRAIIQQEQAARLRADTLLNFPELKPYASLIPATSDPAKMLEYATSFKQARDADLAAQQANTPATPAVPPQNRTPSALDLYGSGYLIPPANPARISPQAGAQSGALEQIEQKLAQALASGDTKTFEAVFEEQKALANAQVAQTIGYHPQLRQ